MRFTRTPWSHPFPVTLEASAAMRTNVRHEGADDSPVVAIASRFGSSRNVFPVYGLGSGSSFDDAVEAAVSAAMDRDPQRYEELSWDSEGNAVGADGEPVEESYVWHVNGVPFCVDTDHDVMIVVVKEGVER